LKHKKTQRKLHIIM